ncbi:MAG TPA: hypothetical protein VG838_11990 [Opitutaceae bacterium]|nr:hypothetical protein [Opitutaceae bacterium]
MKRPSGFPYFHLADSERFRTSLFLGDGLFIWGIACVYTGFAGPGRPQWDTALRLAIGLAGMHAVLLRYSPAWRLARVPAPAGLLAVNGFAAALIATAAKPLGFGGLYQPWLMPLLFAPVQLGLHAIRVRHDEAPLEPLRLALAFAGCVGVTFPLLTTVEVGTGDAYWYANMVADFVTQWRAGIFPVFVGQSIFAFNGTPSPVRLAPYLQHVAGVLDLVTGHILTYPGLLNLILFFSFVGGVFAAYGALVAIEARTRWLALLFALLYIAAPAPLALLYTGNLFMSVCTLPFLPLVMLGVFRSYTGTGHGGFLLLAVGLAATWISHPPIALWCTIAVGVGQIPRFFSWSRPEPRQIRGWLVAGGVFAVLTLFTFVSNLTLPPSGAGVERFLITQSLGDSFTTALLPVSDEAVAPTDHQLGWSLWAALLVGLGGAAALRRKWLVALALGILVILMFVIPVPYLFDAAWKALPQAVVAISFYWPTQRFYLLLSILAVFLGYGVAAGLAARRTWLHAVLAALLLLALYWSGVEASYFVRSGIRRTAAPRLARTAHAPANQILTRYAFNSFPTAPPYFSHGYIDPLWENRVLGSDPTVELASNYATVIGPGSLVRGEGDLGQRDLGSGYYLLLDQLPLPPRRLYSLELQLDHPDLAGTLVGESLNLTRIYDMPESGIGVPLEGKPAGFGSLPTSKKAMSLVNRTAQEDHFQLQFVAQTPPAKSIPTFGRYVLREYDPSALPVKIESWTPYRARVEAPPGAAWLETPRLFLPGYRASVNGAKASVGRSPGGLVMVQIPPGSSRVELTYPGSRLLRLSYGISLLGWIAVAGAGVVLGMRRWKGPGRAAGAAAPDLRSPGAAR